MAINPYRYPIHLLTASLRSEVRPHKSRAQAAQVAGECGEYDHQQNMMDLACTDMGVQ